MTKKIKSFTYYASDFKRKLSLLISIFCVFVLFYCAFKESNLTVMIREYYIFTNYDPNNNILSYEKLLNLKFNIENDYNNLKKYLQFTQFLLPILLFTYIWDMFTLSYKNNNLDKVKTYDSNYKIDFFTRLSFDETIHNRFNNFLSSEKHHIVHSKLLNCMGLTNDDIKSNKQTKDYFIGTFNKLVMLCLSSPDVPKDIVSAKLSTFLNNVIKDDAERLQFECDIRDMFNIPW